MTFTMSVYQIPVMSMHACMRAHPCQSCQSRPRSHSCHFFLGSLLRPPRTPELGPISASSPFYVMYRTHQGQTITHLVVKVPLNNASVGFLSWDARQMMQCGITEYKDVVAKFMSPVCGDGVGTPDSCQMIITWLTANGITQDTLMPDGDNFRRLTKTGDSPGDNIFRGLQEFIDTNKLNAVHGLSDSAYSRGHWRSAFDTISKLLMKMAESRDFSGRAHVMSVGDAKGVYFYIFVPQQLQKSLIGTLSGWTDGSQGVKIEIISTPKMVQITDVRCFIEYPRL